MQKYLIMTDKEDVKSWINVNLSNYLKTNPENQTEIEHIIDYLNSDKRPKRIKFMSYDEAKANTEKWTNTLRKKGADIVETEQDVSVELDFGDGMKLVKLVGEAAFKREGFLMRHCVGSYYGKNDMIIYSLRDYKNEPHATFEVNDRNTQQVKGKGNGDIHPKYINYVLKSLKHFGTEVRSSEMRNLGYLDLNDEMLKFVDDNFTNVKYITFNNKKYLYKYGEVSWR